MAWGNPGYGPSPEPDHADLRPPATELGEINSVVYATHNKHLLKQSEWTKTQRDHI
jgi:hypothetical protein